MGDDLFGNHHENESAAEVRTIWPLSARNLAAWPIGEICIAGKVPPARTFARKYRRQIFKRQAGRRDAGVISFLQHLGACHLPSFNVVE